jgi:hypothetical protein
VAYKPDPTAPNGRTREVTGRAAACTEEGLADFVLRHVEAGDVVDLVEVQPFDVFRELERDAHGNRAYRD